MAQQEGLVETNTDETTQWLESNGLSNIAEICVQNDMIYEVLIEATADDIKAMCDEVNIKTQHRLKLISALKKLPNSKVAQASKPKIVYLSTEEKELVSKLDDTFNEICKDLQQNEQTKKELEKVTNSAILLINSSIDQIIKSIELKRTNMTDKVNKISAEKSTKLQQQQIKSNELKELYTNNKTEIDKICIESTSDKATAIQQIVNNSLNEYNKYRNNANIKCDINVIINTEKIEELMKQNCYIEEEKEEQKEPERQILDDYFEKCGDRIIISNNNKTVRCGENNRDTAYGSVEIDCNNKEIKVYSWIFHINHCDHIWSFMSIGIDESKKQWTNNKFAGKKNTVNYALCGTGTHYMHQGAYIDGTSNDAFKTGDTVTMTLDLNNKTLTYYKNENKNYIAQISNIKTKKLNPLKYNVAVFCYGGSSVTLNAFNVQ